MRINSYINSMCTNKLSKNKKKNGDCLEKISSGKRINRACDDAAGCAISESFRAQVRGLSQSERNVQDGISLLQVADGALEEVTKNIHRMKELAVEAANDTLTEADRECADKEFQGLKDSITGIVNKTEFNEIKLINAKKSITVQIKANPFTTYKIELFDANLDKLGLKNSNLKDSVSIQDSLNDIDGALSKVTEGRSKLGGSLNVLQHTYNDNTNANLNTTASLSTIEDVNMATTYMDFIKGQVLSRYSEVMTASAKQDVESAGNLLR